MLQLAQQGGAAAVPHELSAAALNSLEGDERERSEGEGNKTGNRATRASPISVKRVHQAVRVPQLHTEHLQPSLLNPTHHVVH